jgi:hypothetical protein
MIQTNYNTEKHFVLTNNEDKIMAIINCPAGKNDISEKLKKAISEDEELKSITFENDFIMDNLGVIYIVKALVIHEYYNDNDDDDEEISSYYSLTEAWIY